MVKQIVFAKYNRVDCRCDFNLSAVLLSKLLGYEMSVKQIREMCSSFSKIAFFESRKLFTQNFKNYH